MRLFDLLSEDRLNINAFLILLNLQVKHFVAVVDVLENEGILEHLTRSQFQERVPGHVVREVSHHDRSFSSFFHVFTSNFDEIKVPVNIHLALGVIHYLCCWEDLAISFIVMEQSLQVIVIGSQLVRLLQDKPHPVRNRVISVPLLSVSVEKPMVIIPRPMGILFNLHANAVSSSPFIEIKHNALLHKSESVGSGTDYLLNVIV